jgi:hypothetical protein
MTDAWYTRREDDPQIIEPQQDITPSQLPAWYTRDGPVWETDEAVIEAVG